MYQCLYVHTTDLFHLHPFDSVKHSMYNIAKHLATLWAVRSEIWIIVDGLCREGLGS